MASIPMLELGFIIDIYRPLLVWDNPQRAVKQNMNVVVAMLISLVYIIILGAVCYFSAVIFSIKTAVIIIAVLSILLTILSDRMIRMKFQKMFQRIQI
jgi:ABC-2 type transport system permease protein